MPLAATLATREVFDAFKSLSKVDALLHGHSYSGYPIGCAAAVEALRILGSPQNPALCTPDRCLPPPSTLRTVRACLCSTSISSGLIGPRGLSRLG